MNRTILTAALSFTLAGPLAFAQQPQAPADGQQPPAPITRSQPGTPYGAQDGGVPGPRARRFHKPNPHREAMMLSRRLNLTPDQTAKIEPILTDREQKMDALRANTSLTPDDLRRQMGQLRRQERTEMFAILTPEQQEQFKSMHRGRGGRGPQGTPPAGV
jgi:periplasmic protein CpxP/Spy